MKTKVAAIYGKRDVRLREFELPEITDNELLVSVISDSVCLSTWKAALLGSEHKRVPDDLENHPVITGHECAGIIVEVGKNLTDKYKKGQRFVLQPAMGLPSGYSAGYSYEYFGGNATYMIIPEIAINLSCVLPYHGSYFAAASLAEPMCCITRRDLPYQLSHSQVSVLFSPSPRYFGCTTMRCRFFCWRKNAIGSGIRYRRTSTPPYSSI